MFKKKYFKYVGKMNLQRGGNLPVHDGKTFYQTGKQTLLNLLNNTYNITEITTSTTYTDDDDEHEIEIIFGDTKSADKFIQDIQSELGMRLPDIALSVFLNEEQSKLFFNKINLPMFGKLHKRNLFDVIVYESKQQQQQQYKKGTPNSIIKFISGPIPSIPLSNHDAEIIAREFEDNITLYHPSGLLTFSTIELKQYGWTDNDTQIAMKLRPYVNTNLNSIRFANNDIYVFLMDHILVTAVYKFFKGFFEI
jgi:hypothetical protein